MHGRASTKATRAPLSAGPVEYESAAKPLSYAALGAVCSEMCSDTSPTNEDDRVLITREIWLCDRACAMEHGTSRVLLNPPRGTVGGRGVADLSEL